MTRSVCSWYSAKFGYVGGLGGVDLVSAGALEHHGRWRRTCRCRAPRSPTGWATRLWNQSGLVGAPAFEAKT